MNLRDLQYLVAVADLRHFAKAAESCFVSQPALSMQIKKLEEELGVQLFERSSKHITVTPVGQDIVARARRILQEADDLKALARARQDPFAGEIRLGAFPTLAPYFFPHIVPAITATYPDLKLLLVEEKTETLLALLRQGELDATFLALPVPAREEGLTAIPLFNDPFMLALPLSHPLATRPNVTHDDLAGQELLLLEEGHCLGQQSLEVCDLMGLSAHSDFRATSMETLRQMVIAGSGITLIPQLALRDDDSICYIPFAAPPPARTIALVWRESSARSPCFAALAALIQDIKLPGTMACHGL